MTADPNTYEQPQPVPPPKPRHRKALLIGIAAAIAAVLVTILIIVLTSSGTTSVNGSLSLKCDYQCTKATADGYDGYGDLSEGAQATLVDETGQVIATTELHRKPGDTSGLVDGVWVRTFTFAFTDVPSADRYGLHVGNNNRGTMWKNADEAKRDGFLLTIGN